MRSIRTPTLALAVTGLLFLTSSIEQSTAAAKDRFADGPLVAVNEGQVPMEYIQPGDRVATFQAKSSPAKTDAWLKISFRLKDKSRNEVRVAMLRTKEWVDQYGGYRIGEVRPLKVLLLQLEEDATVVDVQKVKFEPGPGRIVHGKTAYLSDELINLSLRGVGKDLQVTGGHCLFSLDRKKWTAVHDLKAGERLQTAEGEVSIFSSRKLHGWRTAYSLGVEVDAEYLVGEAMLRARDTCDAPSASGTNRHLAN